jgi:hypothetical protein
MKDKYDVVIVEQNCRFNNSEDLAEGGLDVLLIEKGRDRDPVRCAKGVAGCSHKTYDRTKMDCSRVKGSRIIARMVPDINVGDGP